MGKNTIVTIGRQFCSKGNEIGQALSVRLGIPYYDDFILEKAAADHGIPVEHAAHFDEKPATPFEQSIALASYFYSTASTMATTQEQLSAAQRRTICELAEQGPCIIVGRCANYILRENPDVLDVFIFADRAVREKTLMERFGKTEAEARKMLRRIEKERGTYYRLNTGLDWQSPTNYDLMLDSGRFGLDHAVDILVAAYHNV